jgi:adenylate cyclase
MSGHCRTFAPRPSCAHEGAAAGGQVLADSVSGAELVRDNLRRMARLGWAANAVGSVVVFTAIGFLIPIFADADEASRLGLVNLPFLLAYFLVAGIAIRRYLTRFTRRALAWIVEGREPTEAEHRHTLAINPVGVKVDAIAWVIGGVGCGLANGLYSSWSLAAVIVATVWLGGETTGALLYLASERVMRPITARALAARPPTGRAAPGIRSRLAGAWALGTGVPLLGVVVLAVVGVTKSGVSTGYLATAVLFIGLVAMATGVLATFYAAKAIASPVISVRRGLEAIERGELEVEVAVDDGSEVGQLQAGFNRMAEGLRERRLILDLFGRQVGEDVARQALAGGTRLGGEEREIGAVFIDVVGSTSMALAMPPTEVVRLLNHFFRVVVEVVEVEGGMVNKFEGDAALCVFGAPVPSDDPAGDALRCARRLAGRLAAEMPEIDFGVGVSAGVAVAGNIGAESRFEYTVIGDPVNEAARLSELAKRRSERVLAAERALHRAGEAESGAWHVTGSEVLRGRDLATRLAHPRPVA